MGDDLWRDLGIELMGQDAVSALDKIQVDNPGSVTRRCTEMFTLWRQRQPEGNWKQLIKALEEIELITLAIKIKNLLSPSTKQKYTSKQAQIKQDVEHVQEDHNIHRLQLDDGMHMKSNNFCVDSR